MDYLIDTTELDRINSELVIARRRVRELKKQRNKIQGRKPRKTKVKSEIDGYGRNCKKCGDQTVIKKRTKVSAKDKKKSFYYSQWDYCIRCKAVYFDERYKVLNPTLAEQERITNHFNSI